jgi:phosphopantothenoylcysteine decarboxylase / phosphopantothenate---cysteine ligase
MSFRQQPEAEFWVSLSLLAMSENSYMRDLSLDRVRILLGVGGGIAAYKAAELVRRLRDAGAEVRVVMTENATRFVGALTFQALSGNPVRTSLWDENAEAAMGHIELARWADEVLVAPASADLLARLAQGRADDLLSTLVLATSAPVSVAPAMNQQMWAHPATQTNVETLRQRKVRVFGPAAGSQACGDVGQGRLLEAEELVAALAAARGPRLLDGVRVLVSAGPTFEDIDPVRFIGNRSSGKMGFAVAAAAVRAGATVSLIAGPVALQTPVGVKRIDVRSARQMRDAVIAAAVDSDIFISAAAVGDYRPESVAAAKLKKSGKPLALSLVQNPDIIAEVADLPRHPFLVGFAAETNDLERYARDKLERKRLDMIAANQVGDELGFECGENALLLLWADGSEQLALADKYVLAQSLIERVAERYQAAHPARGAA